MVGRRRWLKGLALALGALPLGRTPGTWAGATQAAGAAAAPPGEAGATAEGGRHEVARLALNENPFGPSRAVSTALQRQFPSLCRYVGREYDELIELIAAKESTPKDQIILGEILEPLGTHLSLRGGPGGEFIYSDPGYTALIDSAVAVGGRAVAVPLNARLENDLPAIESRVNERTRAVYLVNPHNPTGIVTDALELKHAVRAISRRALVIVDEAYLEFADHFAERTLTDLVRRGDNVIVFRTFAKIYGLAGLDLGFGLVPKPIAEALSAQGLTNPHLFNRLSIAAAAASLSDPSYVEGVAQRVAEESQKWFRLFDELKVRHTPSAANFVFFETGMAHAEFATRMLQEGVAIGHVFPPYERWARISIGLPSENELAHRAVRKLLATAASRSS